MSISSSYTYSVIPPGIPGDAPAASPQPYPVIPDRTASQPITGTDAVTLSSAAQEAAQSASLNGETFPYHGASASELQTISARVQAELSTAYNEDGLAQNAAQLPVPATPDRLASASGATAFVNSGGTTPNPFAGLSRSALTQIVYDESGKYTVNEREAAASQQGNNDSAFLTAASNRSLATGNRAYIYVALLALHQHKLPVENALPSDTAGLATTTTQLSELALRYGGSEDNIEDYPGGWGS